MGVRAVRYGAESSGWVWREKYAELDIYVRLVVSQ